MQKTTILQQTMQKILIKFLIKRKKRKKVEKKHLQANGFKGVEKTFTKQWGLRFRKIIKKSLTFMCHLFMEKFIMEK
jgi:hypothetical protein